jgi:cysteine desulfurase family protein (TIGR01976 family)
MFTQNENIRCRADFPSLQRSSNGQPLAFLDGPAGTQVPKPVIEAISGYYKTCNANTHGSFVTSQESDAVVTGAREAMAAFLGAPSAREISFGANMTSLNFSLSRALLRTMKPGDEIVITELDHEANRGPWLNLQEHGIVVREVAMLPDGTLDYDDFAAKIGEKTRLVAMGWASNAFGTVNDVFRVRELAKKAGARLLVDAVHYAPHFPIDVVALDCDFLLCSVYKFYGPHVGVLYARPGLLDTIPTDRLVTQDPHAPERIETGTQNHAALAGVNAAVEYAATWGRWTTARDRVVDAKKSIAEWERSLAGYYYENVKTIPRVRVIGPGFSGERAPTVSIAVDGMKAADVASRLGAKGIAVWDGHFYAWKAIEKLGLTEQGGVVRTGISMYNTRGEVDRLLNALKEIAR